MSNELTKPGISPDEAKITGASLVKASRENKRKAGKLLIKAASQKVESTFSDFVLFKVQETLQHLNSLRVQQERIKTEIRLTEARIRAVENGEYSVDWNGNILFDDVKLRY
jgi:hypothetical protein